jgi:hypothetical protein
MPGRGIWPESYGRDDNFTSDPYGRSAFGLYAVKKELVYNGFAIGIDVREPVFCSSTLKQTIDFQKARDLDPDGLIGPITAAALFDARTREIEKRFGIKNNWLLKLKNARSQNDPVAQGPQDEEGLVQVELHFNPSISIEDAWDPAWALDYGVRRLKAAIEFCGGDEQGGIAAWTIGRIFSKDWVEAGKPDSGGPQLGGKDSFSRAAEYVSLVSAC